MGKKNVELAERRRSNMESKRSSTSSLPSLSAPEELHLDLRPAPVAAVTTVTTTVDVERQPVEEDAEGVKRLSKEVDKVKTSSENLKGSKEIVGEAPETVDEKAEAEGADKDKKDVEQQEVDDKSKRMSYSKVGDSETQPSELASARAETDECIGDGEKAKIDAKPDKEGKTSEEKSSAEKVDETSSHNEGEVKKTDDKAEGTISQTDGADVSSDVEIRETSKKGDAERKSSRDSVESKESEGEKTIQKVESKFVQEEKVATVEEGPKVIQGPPTPTSTTAPSQEQQKDSSDSAGADKKEARKSVKFVEENEASSQDAEKIEVPETNKTPPASTEPQDKAAKEASPPREKPKPKKYEYRKAPNPPFVSTSLLKPMKAEPPKPRPVVEKIVDGESPQQEMERWRELEEELLGRGERKIK